MKIKTLRIHYNPDACDDYHTDYTVFDRQGNFKQRRVKAIELLNPPKVLRFGFCPIGTIDVTLEFETPLDSKQIRTTG